VHILRFLPSAVSGLLAASLLSCSPLAPPAQPAVPVPARAPARVPARTPALVPAETPWATMHADRPGALLDAMDRARGEAPGTLARWLLGAPPVAPDAPLRAWVVGEAGAPSLWLAWTGAPALPEPGALLSCDGAAHVCASAPGEIARARAFAGASAGDAKPAAPSPEPAIVARFTRTGIERALPLLVVRGAGVLAQLLEAGARAKNVDRGTIGPLAAGLRNASAVDARKALADIAEAEIRWGAAPGGFRLDAEILYDTRGAWPPARGLGALLSTDDGSDPAVLARRCPAQSHLVYAARQARGQDGLPVIPLVMAFETFSHAIGNEQLSSSLRAAWDATSASSVSCQAWAPDGKTITQAVLGLRDAGAAKRALAQVRPLHLGGAGIKLDVRRTGATVTLDVLRGWETQSLAVGVVGDALVLVLVLAGSAGERIDALRAAPPLTEAPLVGGLDPAPLMFGLDLTKAWQTPGDAVFRGRVELGAPGHVRATVHASAGMVAFVSDLAGTFGSLR
jgi:hypothetical protein